MALAAGREYWRHALTAGGGTVIPRWSREAVPAMAEYLVPIPEEVLAGMRGTAGEHAAGLGSLVLAAHAKVLAALSGEPVVTTGYVAKPGGPALPCRLSTEYGSWRELLGQTRRAETELVAHSDFPIADLQHELGLTGPPCEIVVDPTGAGGDLDPDTVLRVEVALHDGRAGLRLRYRTTVLDADYAARVAGYHLAALASIVSDPDAEHGRQSLLTTEELTFQLDGLAGARRELPDQRFHELFEQRVRQHPDAVAAVHGDRRWTYRELNHRANRVGRALLARGLRREGVVAVVTERNLDWMAAVVAIFKAGGVYLPIEPNLPADRIATMLARAGCDLVLTEAGSTATLDQALVTLPGIRAVVVDAACAEGHACDDLGVAVGPDQLAYVYFTSGSTGEPKGAMCEQAGMLNHLYAKVTDLEIGEGDVVAQTAPQCFDISLWQLVSALLVGGRTQLVEQEAILDVERFVDKVVEGRVGVVQVVPSYLEVVLTYLEAHPRELPDLHCVSVTGEALKPELARRWFGTVPGIMLVNAYGLTETSDDTNHEVMRAAPVGDRVPLGPPIGNVRVYVVDEHLNPVPLGAPGAIVFSGVCVGRGYVNDLERTRLAYQGDPHRPGERLYQAGDHGRWLPGGKLEFLGRRDGQVKISGFRIEIGEIENTLLRVAGVRDGAVVVAEGADRSKHLVGFYSAAQALDVDVLRAGLARSLPAYMVPTVFHWRESLPLTANGKIDKRALTAAADALGVVDDVQERPVTPTEKRLAAAWAGVLGVATAQVGRRDHFFDRGGTSLSAVKVAIAVERAVSLKDITRYPVLAELAALIDGRTVRAPELVPPTPPFEVELQPGKPPIVRVQGGGPAVSWAAAHRQALRGVLTTHGSVVVRGLGLRDPGEVGAVFAELGGGRLLVEREAFAPRSVYAEGVYSSTTWQANQQMCMHHELSYTLDVPGTMMFACLTAPARGGATGVADAPTMLAALPRELVARFEREGWLLVRNYNDEIGASYADAFGTADRGAVEAYCRVNGIDVEWQPDGGLRTRQRRPAVVRHPVTGQRCWFNQVAFLNEWTLEPEVREFLVEDYGCDGLPFTTRFGNGDPIGADVVQLLNEVYADNTRREAWQPGDLLLVDNIRSAHSREPYEGPREIVVGMADPVRMADCTPNGVAGLR